MAWMASNIYVQHEDRDAVADALEQVLRAGEGLRDREGILDTPPAMVVSPAFDGWVVVYRLGPWLQDLPLAAARLAADTGARCAALEMIGNSYRLRYSEFQGTQQVRQLRTPEHGWDGEMDEPPEMPRYEDAEGTAYETLVALGVPRCLITVGQSPLGHQTDERDLGQAAHLRLLDGAQVERQHCPCLVADYAGDDPPVLPTNTSRDFGEMLFEERYVEGAPAEQALAHLLQIEDELRARAERAAPDQDVRLTVTYYAAAHQEKLNTLLQTRDRFNLTEDQRLKRAPWWNFWRFFGKLR